MPTRPIPHTGVPGERRLDVLDRFLPAAALASPEERRRGRLFVVTCGILIAAALFFAWQTVASGGWSMGVTILLVGSALAAANLPIAKATGSLRGPSIAITVELVFVLASMGYVGAGVRDSSLFWLVISPLVGTFLIGPKGGVYVAITASSVVLWLFALEEAGHAFAPMSADSHYFSMLGAVTVMAGIAGIALLYETSRRRAFALVEQTMAELETRAEETAYANEAVRAAKEAAEAESRRKDELLDRMREASRAQSEALDATRAATGDVTRTLRTIASTIETLASASRTADAATQETDQLQAAVSKNVQGTVAAVDETAAALRALDDAVRVVTERFAGLRRAAEDTARAMVAVERNAVDVGENATATAALSDDVIADAERGADAVRRSRGGIDAIRDTARATGGVVRRLGERVESIGAIVGVIDEVAKETNVLALNASIIAAQSGERGRGFGIVAEQIKGLADRTASSTREIASLILAVQDETKNAVVAIQGGEGAVDTGVALSGEAAAALDQIVLSARKATERVRTIADATSSQARAARDVAESMSRVSAQIGDAAAASDAQIAAASQIGSTTARMKQIVPELERVSARQAEAGRRVREATARIAAMAVQLGDVQGAQTKGAESIKSSIERIHEAQLAQLRSMETLKVAPTRGASPPTTSSRSALPR